MTDQQRNELLGEQHLERKEPVGVLFIPGSSGKPIEARYQVVVDQLRGRGYHVASLRWDREKKATMTLRDAHAEIDLGITMLHAEGCKRYVVIAKSFGGSLAATYALRHDHDVSAIAMWAPALGLPGRDPEGTFDNELLDKPFSEYDLPDLSFKLAGLEVPIGLVHSEDDDRIPYANSEQVYEILKGAGRVPSMMTINRGGHSYVGVEDELADVTTRFFDRVLER